MINHRREVCCILICVLAACNGAQPQADIEHQMEPGDTPTIGNSPHTGTPAVSEKPAPPNGLTYTPREVRDSIRVEGTWEPTTLVLIQPDGADPPFITYMPRDFAFEPVSSGEGDGYFFYTNYGGTRDERAYLLFYVFPAATSEAAAVGRVKAWTASRGAPNPSDYKSFQFTQNGERYFGSIDLRKHNDRYYYIAEQYPVEFADGFGPRAEKIKERWKWLI